MNLEVAASNLKIIFIIHYTVTLPNSFLAQNASQPGQCRRSWLKKGWMTKEKSDDMLPLKKMTDPRKISKSGPITVGKEG